MCTTPFAKSPFSNINHQINKWLLSKGKLLALATSLIGGLTISESLRAWTCMSVGAGHYCDLDNVTYGTLTACQVACGLPVTTYTLTLNTTGTGSGVVTGAGNYPAGTAITLGASANAGSIFVGWSTGCNNGMTLNASMTCTATFDKDFSTTPTTLPTPPLPDYLGLFLQLDGTGTGKVTSDTGLSCQTSDCQNLNGSLVCNPQTCSQAVKTSTTVTLTPQADLGSYFSSWGGNQDCLTSPMLMNGGKLCIAYFHLLDEPLTVVIAGQGNVIATPLTCPGTCTANYPYGTTVTLQTQPAAGWQFQA
jgi:hypothetical protein